MTSERLCAGQPSARTPRTALQNAGCGSAPQAAPGADSAKTQLPPDMMNSHWAAATMAVFRMVSMQTMTGSSRPQVFQHTADLCDVVFVQLISQCLLQRVGIPVAHGARLQQAIGIGCGRRIEGQSIALDPERHRSVKSIDRGERAARQVRTAEAAQAIVPQRADPGEIAIERRGNFI